MGAIARRGCAVGLDADDVPFNDIVVAVFINNDTGKAVASGNVPLIGSRTTNLVSGCIVTDHDAVFGITSDIAGRVDPDPVVLNDVVITESGRAIHFDAFIGKVDDNKALDGAVVGAESYAIDTGTRRRCGTIQRNQWRAAVTGLRGGIENDRIGNNGQASRDRP